MDYSWQHVLINIRDPVTRYTSVINYEYNEIKRTYQKCIEKCPDSKPLETEPRDVYVQNKHYDPRNAYHDYLNCRCTPDQYNPWVVRFAAFNYNPSKVAEALTSSNATTRQAAGWLLHACWHSMSLSKHVGGVETLDKLAERGVAFYVTPMSNNANFKALIQTTLTELVTNAGIKTSLPIHPPVVVIYAGHYDGGHGTEHRSTGHKELSSLAVKNIVKYYREDYDVIDRLRTLSCRTSNVRYRCMFCFVGLLRYSTPSKNV